MTARDETMTLPPRAGLGLKPQHYDAILSGEPDVGFFEVHAENYMGAGGPPHRHLEAIAARFEEGAVRDAVSGAIERRLEQVLGA